MLYGAETWAVKKTHEKRMEVAEMRMMRWSCGVTRLDRIRNEIIRNKIKLTEISKKVQERRPQWFGHVERRDESYVRKKEKTEKEEEEEERFGIHIIRNIGNNNDKYVLIFNARIGLNSPFTPTISSIIRWSNIKLR
uniref:Uncharacterized protein n=1 Tax=Cacopsylla melanoneura TaxID=428564 RepID=A0A8D8ZUW1_9HEMI